MSVLVAASFFALGVVSSETVRRLWNAYVAPKIAELEAEVKTKL